MKKNTRKLKKAALLLCSAVLLVCISIGATVAYLTSSKTVTNTFTVGKVEIKLDEAVVDANGNDLGTRTEQGNANYKLLPGHTYTKDPTVTVLKGSESCYVKMTVTFTKADELDAIFDPNGATLTSIFNGYDSTNWTYKGNAEDTSANTRTYEFWYKEAVAAPDGNVALDALFDSITVPGTITNAQLATIDGMTITVNAYAIQADGFSTADDAWAKYSA